MPQSLDPSEDEFFRELGVALSEWQLVETALCHLFETIVRGPDSRCAAEVFYAVANFRDKLGMVDAAVQFTLWRHKTLKPDWEDLREATRKRSLRRNKIVHGHDWSELNEDHQVVHKLGQPRTLTNVMAAEGSPQKLIDIKQLREAGRSFRELSMQIREFDEQVHAFLMRQL